MKSFYCKPRKTWRSQRGFALPTVLSVGLILVLISLTIIVRTISDRQLADAQGFGVQSLITAEIGVTRIQDLLLKYPGLAAQSDISTWSRAIAARQPSATCGTQTPPAAVPVSSTDERLINAVRDQQWITVDANNTSLGQFQVDRYAIDANIGQLSVKGQLGVSGRSANAALDVRMPLTFAAPAAGIWVTSTSATNPPIVIDQNRVLAANVFVEDPNNTFNRNAYVASGFCNKFVDGSCNQYDIRKSSANKPTPPAIPSNSWARQGQTIPNALSSNAVVTLPRLQSPTPDQADADGNFRYRISGDNALSLIDDAQIVIQPPNNSKVILYLSKGLSVSGNAQLNANGKPESLEIYGSSPAQNYGSSGQTKTETVNLNTTKAIKAFIYVPEAEVILQGNEVTVEGAVWAKSFKTTQVKSNAPVVTQSNCLNNLEVGNVQPTNEQTATVRPTQFWQRKSAKP